MVAPPATQPSNELAEAVETHRSLVVFPRLSVGRADDLAERDADRLADAALGGQVAHRSATGADRLGGLPVDAGTEARIERLRGGGRALDDRTRATLEPGFGVDLSSVRIHTGAEPDRLNQSLEAKAFTTGHDIFFRSDAYRPDTVEGLGLVAHEVAHAMQHEPGAALRRAFEPKDPDLSSITDVKVLGGGTANKGVYLLTGSGGKQLVAKFVEKLAGGERLADAVLKHAGVGNPDSHPYGAVEAGAILDAITAFAASLDGENQGLADSLMHEVRRSQAAKAVLVMRPVGGVEFGNVAMAAGDDVAHPDDAPYILDARAKTSAQGIDLVTVVQSSQFHEDLGRVYVADALLGAADRFAHTPGGYTVVNASNFMVTAQGYINTLDNETVMVSYELLHRSKEADTSATAWAKWLIEGGNVERNLGLEVSGAFTQDLLRMFSVDARKAMFAKLLDTAQRTSHNALPADTVDFGTFDTSFRKGITDAAEGLVGGLQALLADARASTDTEGRTDAEALEVKMEFLASVLPTMQAGGEVDDPVAARGYAAARLKAEKIVARKEMENRARLLKSLDPSLTSVPNRPAALSARKKAGRTVGRLAQKALGQNKDKRARSKQAKELRKASGTMVIDQLDQAAGAIGAMGDSSRRQEAASFEVGLRSAVLKTHRHARLFQNAQADVSGVMKGVSDVKARRDHLAPYGKSDDYQAVVPKYQAVVDDYARQLTPGERALKDDLAGAMEDLREQVDEFEAELDYVRR